MVLWCASLRLYLQLEMSKRSDENLTETTKVLAIRNMLKLFHSLISLIGCVGNVLGPHTDNIWQSKTKRECLRSIHFRIQNVYIQMLAKHSYICLESQQNQIDVPSQRTFCFSFGKTNLQRQRKSMQNLYGMIVGSLQSLCSRIVMICRWYFGVWWCHFRRPTQDQFRWHESWVVFGDKIRQAFSSNVREASPACTHPFNTKWEAQFIALAQSFGGWSAGPSRHTQPTRRWTHESSKYGHWGMQQMLLDQIFLASLVLQPPQTQYISALNHIIRCLYLFCRAWLEMTCFNKLGK